MFRVPETWWYLVILHFNYVKNDEDMLFFYSRHNDIFPSAFEKNTYQRQNVEKRKIQNFYLYLLLALELKGAKKTRFYVGYPIPFTMSTLSRDIIKVFTPSQKKNPFYFFNNFSRSTNKSDRNSLLF